MTMPIPAAAFRRSDIAVRIVEGLAGALDTVADRSATAHRFLRHGWFAAAIAAYGGSARTLVVEEAGKPVLAMPLVGFGPTVLGLRAIPGCYWPFRTFPIAVRAGGGALRAALAALAAEARGLRIGPVYDDDSTAMPLIEAARAQGWAAIDRFVADSWLLDIAALTADGQWPRGSTLRKNRYHEKQLAAQGELTWRFVSGGDWTNATFDALAAVEELSWIATRTGGEDAKFTMRGHGAFWRAAARDPVIAAMMRAAVLEVDGRPAALSFNLDMPQCGRASLRFAIANSYDPQYAKYSPGKLLQYRDMAAAMERGIGIVDWGAGDSGYKQVLGAHRGPAIRDWLLLRPGLPAALGRMLASRFRATGNVPSAD